LEVVFVGGTGRSGTHVIAKLLGRSSRYRKVPIEVRFHVDAGGFPDLLAGRTTPERFLVRLRGKWWKRVQTLRSRGLHHIVPRDRLDEAADDFAGAYEADPLAACRGLFLALLAPLADERGKPDLVEMSCDTVAQGPTLLRIFPEAKLIHTVRDGRDASASRVSQGRRLIRPRTRRQGLEWWEARLRRIDRAAREIPEDRLLVVSLDELVAEQSGEESDYGRLVEFCGIDHEPGMRRFFERKMNPERAHRERWRDGLSQRAQRRLADQYEDALERLARDGVHCVPMLRRTAERVS
jgi:Sulfotransferase family